MNAEERIKEIKKLQIPSGNPTSRLFSDSDKKYLIDRIEHLTHALERISYMYPDEAETEARIVAREALEEK